MPVDRSALLERLIFAAHRRPATSSGTSHSQLEEARTVVARAIAGGQSGFLPRASGAASTLQPRVITAAHQASLDSAVESALARTAATPEFLVALSLPSWLPASKALPLTGPPGERLTVLSDRFRTRSADRSGSISSRLSGNSIWCTVRALLPSSRCQYKVWS